MFLPFFKLSAGNEFASQYTLTYVSLNDPVTSSIKNVAWNEKK